MLEGKGRLRWVRCLPKCSGVAAVQSLMTTLLIWISANSNLQYDGISFPKLALADGKALHEMAFGQNMPKAIRTGKYRVSGLYNHVDNTIYLVDTTDLNSDGGKALLVHELVHYLQHLNGRTNDHELKVLEPLAYLLEANWLRTRLLGWYDEADAPTVSLQ